MKFDGEMNLNIEIEINEIDIQPSFFGTFKIKQVRLIVTQSGEVLYDGWLKVGSTMTLQ